MKWILVTAAVAAFSLAACQTTTQKPSSSVSHAFDGAWVGERVDEAGAAMCMATEISGKVRGGLADFTLHYNGTSLSGRIQEDGSVTLVHDSPQWDYKFSGKAAGDRIAGTWSVTDAPCRGTWYVKRR